MTLFVGHLFVDLDSFSVSHVAEATKRLKIFLIFSCVTGGLCIGGSAATNNRAALITINFILFTLLIACGVACVALLGSLWRKTKRSTSRYGAVAFQVLKFSARAVSKDLFLKLILDFKQMVVAIANQIILRFTLFSCRISRRASCVASFT